MKQTRYISKTIEEYDAEFPPEDATECVAWFTKVLSDIPEQYRSIAKIRIGSETSYDWHKPVIKVSYTRPETDEEEAERESAERASLAAQREAELRTLAALQAKYGTKP